jgi:hypothetical protein
MSEQEKAEIREIIKEEIEARYSVSSTKNSTKTQEPLSARPDTRRVVYVETVSPAY